MKIKTEQNTETEPIAPPLDGGGKEKETSADLAVTQLQAENEQLKATIRLNEAHRQITGELVRAGARSPELLFDSVKGDLQFDDDGKAMNTTALIERLKMGFPEQFEADQPTVSIDGGAGRIAQPQLTKESLARMTATEIAELDWADVRRVLAAG